VDPAVAINYQGIGSGGGKKAIVDGTVDFAVPTHCWQMRTIPPAKTCRCTRCRQRCSRHLQHCAQTRADARCSCNRYPVAKLILDRQTLVDIYNAKITKWNDPAILALNPGLKDYLPDAQITAVHRSDGSGTTENLTKSLASFRRLDRRWCFRCGMARRQGR